MHEEEHCQQVKGSDPTSVVSAGETSGVLGSGGAVARSEYKKDKDVLEQIHCSATKVTERLEHVSYMEIVVELGVFSLEKRRFRGSYPYV